MYVFTDSTLKYLLKKIKSKIALKSELDNKLDKVDGKGLSDNDFTDSAKSLLETKFTSVEASYSTGMTHIKFSNENDSSTKTIDLKTGCDMFFYPTIDAELLSDLNGNVTIPYAFISKSGSDIGKVTVKIENLTNNTISENVFNVTDNGSELILEGASSGNANVSFVIEGNTEGLKANVLGEYSTVIMLPLTVYRSTNPSLIPSNVNVSNVKTVVSDFGNGEYEIILYTATSTKSLDFNNQKTLTNVSYISDSITSMYYTYDNCNRLTGSPICGNNVTSMINTYSNCNRLTGSPVCGDKVTSMMNTYHNCNRLTGSPVCGDNVTSMYRTYHNCTNLTGSPVCGDKVTSMVNTYSNCNRLTGSPVCGPNVTNMANTYHNCTNLTGSPVCGPNVTNMYETYHNCTNLTGSPVCGDKVTSMVNTYRNCYNLTGSPVCGPNVTNMANTYYNCRKLTGSPVCGDNVTNMYNTYYDCTKLTGSPVCGDKVTDMASTYFNCTSLTGSPVCRPNVTNMYCAYSRCSNLTGNPACGDKVTTMYGTYDNCSNLTGSPVCGDNVTNMSAAYYNCQSLTGNPVCGPKVTDMNSAYGSCYNLTGSPICGPNVTNMMYTYRNCKSLGHNGYFFSNKISNAYGCFAGRNIHNRLNLYVPNAGPNSTYNTLKWCLVSNTHSLLANNVSWTDDMASNECYYNTAYNIYIYPVGNVSQVYKENELLVARYTMNSGANVVPEATIEGKREIKVTSENYNPQFSLGTLGVDITSMKEITTSVGDFYYMDDYTDILGYVEYRYGASGKDRVYLSVDSDTKNVFINNMLTSDSEALEEVTLYIPEKVDLTTMTTMEDTTNDDGTITRSVYLDESQAVKLPSSISFNGATNLLTVEKLKIDNITDTSYMFNGCDNLTSVCTMDWDTSKILYADYMFAGCSKLTKESFEGSSYGYDLKYESKTYTLNFNEEIKLFNYPSSEFNFITLSYPITEYEEGYHNFNPRIERDDMYGCTYYSFGNTEPVIITVYDDGSIYAYSNGPGGDFSLYLYNRHKHTFELPNVESASHIFDGCTNLL